MAESKIEAQLVQCSAGGTFVWSVFQYEFRSIVVTGDGDSVAGGKAIEEGMDRLKMAALDEIYGWTCFDEEQDLSRLVDGEEIRDGLLDTVVEKVEVFAVKTANELPVRVGDDDSDVDAVHADADVGRGLGGLLAKSGRKQEGAGDREKCPA